MKKQNDNRIRKTGLGARASRRLSNALIYVILIAITLVWLFPFVGIVLESFKTETTMQTPYLFPKDPGFDHYIKLFKETDFLKWFINTAIMGVATAALQTILILSYLTGDNSDAMIAKLVEDKLDIDIIHTALTEERIQAMHAAGLVVNCWTVDDPARGEELAAWGVDQITSNILQGIN